MRFACQSGCNKCCTRRGSVYLTESDLMNAATFLGITAHDFETQHVIRFRHILRLRKPARGTNECRFLKNGGCAIHPAKPTQCRAFPFWPSVIQNKAMWGLEGTFCPGIGKGALVQIKTAKKIAAEMTTAYPTLPGF